MARIPLLTPETLSDPGGRLDQFDGWEGSNVLRAKANSPGALAMSMWHARWMREWFSLPSRQRELAILQVGYATEAAYEWAHHVVTGLANGLAEEDIRAISRESLGEHSHLSPVDRCILRASRELVYDETVSDETFRNLEEYFQAEQLVDLIYLICYYIGAVRGMRTFNIELEPRFAEILSRFPLASALD
ncbi:MAG TPA: carboxymuconolactone decarboxylase family protein [Jatrophihabitantaceae bacterium]|jgi:alkylhydroperoxidase family enzyme|nr:carboxymuconolactone decarboxylase family protein [Jatrophihabitantaceae bacterium]